MTNHILPEDGFTTNTPTGGKIKYFLTPSALRRVKAAAKIAGLPYQSIAARPSTALEFCIRAEGDHK